MGRVESVVERDPQARDTARAMWEENVEIVRAAAAAASRGDLDAWLEYWTEDLDFRAAEGAPDDHGTINGKDAQRVFGQDWLDTFDEFKVEQFELIDAGDDNVLRS